MNVDTISSAGAIGTTGPLGRPGRDLGLAAEGLVEQLDAELVHPEPRPLMHLVLGRPLETAAAPHQTIGKAVGMAVFASDALSSVAYASQEILLVLAAAGAIYFSFALPVAVAIATLLIIV